MIKVSQTLSMSLRLVAIALSMVMLATACGGDTGSSASDDGGDSAASGDETDSSESGRAFCDIAREQEVRSDSFNPFGAESADVEAFFTGQFALLAEGIAAAPNDGIKADLELLQSAQSEMATITEAADWDIFAVDPDEFERIQDRPELDAASNRVEAYGEAECGIRPGDDDTSEEFEDDAGDFEDSPELLEEMFESPAMRAFMVEDMMSESGVTEDQANCFVDSIVELGLFSARGDEEPDLGELIAMLEIYDRCGIDPDAFDE